LHQVLTTFRPQNHYGAISTAGLPVSTAAQAVSPGRCLGKYFATEPMGDPPDSTLWAELIEIVEPGQANSVARDIVQLYR
jgi:hypothetical protein